MSGPTRRLVVEADGGSRGNPGVAGYGSLVRDPDSGAVLAELAAPLGRASNNVAEYTGLIEGLGAVIELSRGEPVEVTVRMDSKLVVEQMSGRWKIKHEDMQRLALTARDHVRTITAAGGRVGFEWIPREQNKAADALSNDGMDGRTIRRFPATHATTPDGAPVAGPLDEPEGAARRGGGGRSTGEGAGSGSAGSGSVSASVSASVGTGEPDAAGLATRKSLRLLLAQVGEDPADDEKVVDGIGWTVGTGAHLVAPAEGRARELADLCTQRLEARLVVDDAWSAGDPTRGPDDRAVRAFERLCAQGGTAVVLTSRLGVASVLSHVLGLAEDRLWSFATGPGSLSAIEMREDGTASVVFTNRTSHLS